MKKKVKVLIGAGIACLLFVLVSVWYAVTYNESRLVVPMEASEYVFTVKDLPMILSVVLATLYAFVLMGGDRCFCCREQEKGGNDTDYKKIESKVWFSWIPGIYGFLWILDVSC